VFASEEYDMNDKHRESWRILHIDDDEEDYLLTRNLLSQLEGRKIYLEWSATYEDGCAKLADLLSGSDRHYDAVLVDYDLCGKTGIELIQEFSVQSPTPLILYTGQGTPEVDLEAMQAGATMYLTKEEANPLLFERIIRYAIERKQAESEREGLLDEIQRQKNLLEGLVENSPVGIAVLQGPEHRFVLVNPTQERLFPEIPEFIGRTVAEIWPDQKEVFNPILERVFNTGEPFYAVDAPWKTNKGNGPEDSYYTFSYSPIFGVWGDIEGILVLSVETTEQVNIRRRLEAELGERNKIEQAQRESEARLQLIMDASPNLIWSVFPGGQADYVNKAWCEYAGFTPDELNQAGWQSLIHPEETERVEAIWADATRKGASLEAEFRLRRHDGIYDWFSCHASPVKDEKGTILKWIGFMQDISERKQAEVDLSVSEQKFRSAFDNAAIGFAVTLPDGRIVDVNSAYCQITGYNAGELKDNTIDHLIHPDDQEENLELVDQMLAGQIPNFVVEKRYIRKDGQTIWVRESGSAVRSPQGDPQLMVALIEDITNRRQAEGALQESEARFRAMADGTPVIIWVTDPEGKIEFINRSYSEFFGVTLEQVKSDSWTMLVHPDDMAGYVDVFFDCLREQKPFRALTRIRRYDGKWRWIDSQGRPRFSKTGEFLGIAGSSLDVTERMRAERELKHYTAELERSNQALKDFAFIASHDLQEPLRKVMAFGHMLDTRFSDQLGEEGQDYIARITSAAARMSEMLRGLLAYSRIATQGEAFVDVNLRKIARDVLSDLEMRLRETKGKVELGELPVIEGDPLQLHQVLLNLIGNALKYQRPGIPPLVQLSSHPVGEKRIRIFVKDNGIGLNMEDACRIFQPFTRLHGHSEYEGTGMGLAICQKIVERHGGSLSVESTPGVGSTFHLDLPTKH
jgi:PAS domain S-box-containing protein